MKKLAIILGMALCIGACNGPSTKGTDATDSLHNDNINNSDVNNRNTTVYDSANVPKDSSALEKKKDK